ncbi:MAG: hypothetical protein ACR2JU_12790 [Nocardioidaceae bacterium]
MNGFEHPNDVLRRLLLREAAPIKGAKPTPIRRGKLWPLMQAGLIKEGDILFHERPRKGERFEATVTAHGWVVVNGDLFQSPSPALGTLVGTQIDGWKNWTHQRSGKTLRRLRWELGQSGSATG